MIETAGVLRTIAMVVEYDGTGYHGMQRQTTLPTVAGELERALSKLFAHDVRIVAAGRTDAGVHATGQVVSCTTTSAFDLARLPIAASAMLRGSRIAILRAVEREPGFSARRHALARSYRYRIVNRTAPSPLNERRAFHVRAALEIATMRAGSEQLVGEHDFAAFCATPPVRGGTTRTLTGISVDRAGDFVELWMTADSFLHQMVRIVVGTLVDVGRGRLTPQEVGAILVSRQRERAGFTAPPHGLFLERVHYAHPI
ncbi:MAG: tRNA pseudouridine(38-40) synthase TruA [Candidatus Eremiobacterales bacterium]